MKIWWLGVLIFFSQLSQADSTPWSKYACVHLKVSIRNETPHTCYLLAEELSSSFISSGHDLVFKISSGETSTPVDIEQESLNEGAGIELVYECGEGSEIRLYSQKNACGYSNHTYSSLFYASNLTATSLTTPANYWSNTSAEVKWTISNG